MKLIDTKDAVGHVLCHDITQIVRGVTKDAVFRKGHVVREEDIPVLLSVGKEHLYVWENDDTMYHENEAAEILREICQGVNLRPSDVKEGKIELTATCDGVLSIDVDKLDGINALGDMMIASRHGNLPLKAGDKVAGTRVIPLVIKKDRMALAREIGGDAPIFNVRPYLAHKAGIVTTGSEVFKGRIKDTFSPVVRDKLAEVGITDVAVTACDDDPAMITGAIAAFLSDGCDLVTVTGGMSVDPDDRTPLAIRNTGAEVVTYGAPVLPGAMFMLAYTQGGAAIMGLPGCVMYSRRTIFDLVLPRVACGQRLNAGDFHKMGQGGLCLSCPMCTFPNCGFGHCG